MTLTKLETLAMELARRNGGKLNLVQAGLVYGWQAGDEPKAIGHTTVKSLVRKGQARYTSHQASITGVRYPVEITLTECL